MGPKPIGLPWSGSGKPKVAKTPPHHRPAPSPHVVHSSVCEVRSTVAALCATGAHRSGDVIASDVRNGCATSVRMCPRDDFAMSAVTRKVRAGMRDDQAMSAQRACDKCGMIPQRPPHNAHGKYAGLSSNVRRNMRDVNAGRSRNVRRIVRTGNMRDDPEMSSATYVQEMLDDPTTSVWRATGQARRSTLPEFFFLKNRFFDAIWQKSCIDRSEPEAMIPLLPQRWIRIPLPRHSKSLKI
ncbi:hypothetical protein F511_44293 [Dorcoceras hygrometricum]|uniref:Uncharacterized protein n=1 Tax=Dorcoceras hygrometricum TaxID=472368 RepID=A0A2Z6ZY68_9LAMI|nr:hypothetical protein F511_44293 [Dorcoceras hygrometricum]